MMNGQEKSDPGIVAGKRTNKAGRAAAESVEPRLGTKGNVGQQSTHRAQDRARVTHALERVRNVAKLKRKERFLEHRIGDKRIIRLIQKSLRAGIVEDGIVTVDDRGTGHGSVISPLLGTIYLHYVLDLWANRWRQRDTTGEMIIVRYADDVIVGFERENDAHRFLNAMRARLSEFTLPLHPVIDLNALDDRPHPGLAEGDIPGRDVFAHGAP